MFTTANPSIGGFDVRGLMFDLVPQPHLRFFGTVAGEINLHPKSLSNSLCVPIHAHEIASPWRSPTARYRSLIRTDQIRS
jgi:hypothetical protein